MSTNGIRPLLSKVACVFRPNNYVFLNRVSGVVHIGANSGQERDQYFRHKLSVLWVEAIPSIFTELQKNIENYDSQIAVQALVTDVEDKEYQFHIASNGGASSSILEMRMHREVWPEIGYTDTISLSSTTLPTLLSNESVDIDTYQALVLDTQGSELRVLQGAIPILEKFSFIQIETSDFEAYDGACSPEEVRSFMHEHGFHEMSRKTFPCVEVQGNYFEIVYARKNLPWRQRFPKYFFPNK